MLLSLVSLAFAGDDPVDADKGRPIKYKERTEIEFEGVGVTGELTGPGVEIVIEPPKVPPRLLITLRENWDQETLWSIDDVK